MIRLSIETPDRAQQVVQDLCRDMGHRIAANPPGLCPVDMALNFYAFAMPRPAASVFPAASDFPSWKRCWKVYWTRQPRRHHRPD